MADAILSRRESAVKRRGVSRNKPGASHQVLFGLVILLFLVLAGELVYHFVLVPYFRISKIVVESDSRVSEDVLRNLAGITPDASLLTMNPRVTADRIAAHPSVREVSVSRSFPETLILQVETREPVAVVLAEVEGNQRAVLIDDNGILFERGTLTAEKAADLRLPALSGLQLEGFTAGMELPIRLLGLVKRLKEMQIEAPQLFRQISEIRVVPRGSHEFEVLVYPMSYPVVLRMDSDFTIDQCTYALVVLDALRQDGRLAELAEVDARGQDMVLRLREGTGG
ncbi:MAG: cell division protein FtsQ/DivIB [Spirochaetota bacterium]